MPTQKILARLSEFNVVRGENHRGEGRIELTMPSPWRRMTLDEACQLAEALDDAITVGREWEESDRERKASK